MRQPMTLLMGLFSCAFLLFSVPLARAQAPNSNTANGGVMLGMGSGNVYVAKSVNGLPDFKMIYKKSTANGAETPIGTQQKGHYLISNPADIPAFEAATGLHAVTQQEMAAGVLNQPAAGQPTPQVPSVQPSNQAASPSEGTVSDLSNGSIHVVFTSGRYVGDTVDFTKDGGDVFLRHGDELKGEAKYGGGYHNPGKATSNVLKGLGSVAWNNSNVGASTINQGDNWTLTAYLNGKAGGSVNTEHTGAGKLSGGIGYDLNGMAAETLAANDILIKAKPDFVLQNAGKLRDLASYQASPSVTPSK